MKRVVFLLAVLILPASNVEAQEERQSGFMAAQWMICEDENMPEIDRLTTQNMAIVEELREEGMIRAWYEVRHAWGDEWNWGVITVADSHRVWLDFFAEWLRRIENSAPELMTEFPPLCTLHKDNFYTVRNSGAGGP